MKNSFRRGLIHIGTLSALIICPSILQANLLVSFSDPGSLSWGEQQVVGYTFSVSSPIVIDGLAAFDEGQDGLGANVPVGLWAAEGGPSLFEATIPAGTGPALDGFFRWVPITPATLQPGEYTVGALYAGWTSVPDPSAFQEKLAYDPIGLSLQAGTAYLGWNYVHSGVLDFPVNSGTGSVGWFGGNVHIQAAVPDGTPGLATGLVLLGLCLTHARSARNGRMA